MMSRTGVPHARMNVQVIDPVDLDARMLVRQAAIREASAVEPLDSAARLDSALRRASTIGDATEPVVDVHPGLRGKTAGVVKRQIARLIYWYVDPRTRAQNEKNAVIAQLIGDQAHELADLRRELIELRHDLNHVHHWNSRLMQQSRRFTTNEIG